MQKFEELLSSTVRRGSVSPRSLGEGECQSQSGMRCRLCHAVNLDYKSEVQFKTEALQTFWKTVRTSCRLDPLVVSPRGRHYRTTSKRRVFALRDSIRLGLISPNEEGHLKPFSVVQCAIEPEQHCEIYNRIQEVIAKPYAKRLAKSLHYVIIKGSYTEQTVIFNVEDISPEVLHAATTLSKTLTKSFESIVGLFLYEEGGSPQYYLGVKNKNVKPKFKKLFGKPEIFQRVLGKSFLYSPLSFSQINQSILESMIQSAGELLRPSKEGLLFDLYCGYGLFALCLSGKFRSVIAAEVSPASIESAIANAKRQKTSNVRFIRSDINDESIRRVMADASPADVVVLDPPRKGTSDGVIEHIAAKTPARVVHLFCEIDLIAKELKRWEKSGYEPVRAIPFDMFPGTSAVEIMVLLQQK